MSRHRRQRNRRNLVTAHKTEQYKKLVRALRQDDSDPMQRPVVGFDLGYDGMSAMMQGYYDAQSILHVQSFEVIDDPKTWSQEAASRSRAQSRGFQASDRAATLRNGQTSRPLGHV